MNDVTRILASIERGDPHAAEQLLPLVYDELRKLAAARMAIESPDHTLEATALVHEAYLRLAGGNEAQHWKSRGHFFGAAAEAMRRILVDRARRKRRPKHGGDRRRVELHDVCVLSDERAEQLLSLDAALEKLAAESPVKAQLVKLRYFAGLAQEEAADALEISRATADRYWAYAKVFLYSEMNDPEKDRNRRYDTAAKKYRPRAWDWCFLAMARHRLGNADEARRCLSEATRWIDAANHHTEDDPSGGGPTLLAGEIQVQTHGHSCRKLRPIR